MNLFLLLNIKSLNKLECTLYKLNAHLNLKLFKIEKTIMILHYIFELALLSYYIIYFFPSRSKYYKRIQSINYKRIERKSTSNRFY